MSTAASKAGCPPPERGHTASAVPLYGWDADMDWYAPQSYPSQPRRWLARSCRAIKVLLLLALTAAVVAPGLSGLLPNGLLPFAFQLYDHSAAGWDAAARFIASAPAGGVVNTWQQQHQQHQQQQHSVPTAASLLTLTSTGQPCMGPLWFCLWALLSITYSVTPDFRPRGSTGVVHKCRYKLHPMSPNPVLWTLSIFFHVSKWVLRNIISLLVVVSAAFLALVGSVCLIVTALALICAYLIVQHVICTIAIFFRCGIAACRALWRCKLLRCLLVDMLSSVSCSFSLQYQMNYLAVNCKWEMLACLHLLPWLIFWHAGGPLMCLRLLLSVAQVLWGALSSIALALAATCCLGLHLLCITCTCMTRLLNKRVMQSRAGPFLAIVFPCMLSSVWHLVHMPWPAYLGSTVYQFSFAEPYIALSSLAPFDCEIAWVVVYVSVCFAILARVSLRCISGTDSCTTRTPARTADLHHAPCCCRAGKCSQESHAVVGAWKHQLQFCLSVRSLVWEVLMSAIAFALLILIPICTSSLDLYLGTYAWLQVVYGCAVGVVCRLVVVAPVAVAVKAVREAYAKLAAHEASACCCDPGCWSYCITIMGFIVQDVWAVVLFVIGSSTASLCLLYHALCGLLCLAGNAMAGLLKSCRHKPSLSRASAQCSKARGTMSKVMRWTWTPVMVLLILVFAIAGAQAVDPTGGLAAVPPTVVSPISAAAASMRGGPAVVAATAASVALATASSVLLQGSSQQAPSSGPSVADDQTSSHTGQPGPAQGVKHPKGSTVWHFSRIHGVRPATVAAIDYSVSPVQYVLEMGDKSTVYTEATHVLHRTGAVPPAATTFAVNAASHQQATDASVPNRAAPRQSDAAQPAPSTAAAVQQSSDTERVGCVDVEADQKVPEVFLKFCQMKAADFPTRYSGRRTGWCHTYNKGEKKGQPLPKLDTFIFSFPDPTLLPDKNDVVTGKHSPPSFRDFCVARSKVIIWKPDAYWHAFGVEVFCPYCRQSKHVMHKSWVTAPRRVCGLNTTYYLFSYQYTCKCGNAKGPERSFTATHPGVMEQFPEFVQSALPVKITKKGAICTTVLEQLVHQIITTSNFKAAAKELRTLSYMHFHRAQNEYLQFVQHRQALYQRSLKLHISGKKPYDTSTCGIKDEGVLDMFCYNPSANWLEDIFMECIQQPMDFICRYQASILGTYLCADHTFKAAKYIRSPDRSKTYEAIFTVMNEYCQVVAQFMVQTKSWLEIQAGMELLWKRYGLLSQHMAVPIESLLPKYLWVDDVEQSSAKISSSFQQAMSGQQIQHSIKVLMDSTHLMRRYMRTCKEGHSLYGDFMKALSAAIFDWHQPDREAALDRLNKEVAAGKITQQDMQNCIASSKFWEENCRRIIPGPTELVQRLSAAFDKFAGDNGLDPKLGQLFTAETSKVHARTLDLVEAGFLSDPVDVDDMHYDRTSNASSQTKLIKKRGTSKLEGYHPKLHDVFSGNNYSGELAFALVMLFNFTWNVSRGVENCKEHNYGCYQLWRIEEINQRAKQLGLEMPHPDVSHNILPKTTEQFCTRYDSTPEVLVMARAEANALAHARDTDGAQADDPDGSPVDIDDIPPPVPAAANPQPARNSNTTGVPRSSTATSCGSSPSKEQLKSMLRTAKNKADCYEKKVLILTGHLGALSASVHASAAAATAADSYVGLGAQGQQQQASTGDEPHPMQRQQRQQHQQQQWQPQRQQQQQQQQWQPQRHQQRQQRQPQRQHQHQQQRQPQQPRQQQQASMPSGQQQAQQPNQTRHQRQEPAQSVPPQAAVSPMADVGQQACHKCGQTGHSVNDCPDVECYRCGLRGHGAKGCRTCSYCKAPNADHWAANCPLKQQSNQTDPATPGAAARGPTAAQAAPAAPAAGATTTLPAAGAAAGESRSMPSTVMDAATAAEPSQRRSTRLSSAGTPAKAAQQRDYMYDSDLADFAELNLNFSAELYAILDSNDTEVHQPVSQHVSDGQLVNPAQQGALPGSLPGGSRCSSPAIVIDDSQPGVDRRCSSTAISIEDSQPGVDRAPSVAVSEGESLCGQYSMLCATTPEPVITADMARLTGPYDLVPGDTSDKQRLNDVLVNIVLDLLLRENLARCRGIASQPKCFVFKSYFFNKLLQWPDKPPLWTPDRWQLDDTLRRWAWPHVLERCLQRPNATLFSFDLVLVPVCFGYHWLLVLADMKAGCVHVYDSMDDDYIPRTRAEQWAKLFLRYLDDHMSVMKLKSSKSKDVLSWPVKYHGAEGADRVPQQSGGIACGGYMLSFAEAVMQTGRTEPSLWRDSAMITSQGYNGYKEYLKRRITGSDNYQPVGYRTQCGSQPEGAGSPAQQIPTPTTTAPLGAEISAHAAFEATAAATSRQQVPNAPLTQPAADSAARTPSAIAEELAATPSVMQHEVPNIVNQTDAQLAPSMQQKRSPNSRRRATPAESRHAHGGLRTSAELAKFNELLPRFIKGTTVDFVAFMTEWNSKHATTPHQLEAMSSSEQDAVIRQVDVPNLKWHHKSLQAAAQLKQAQELIEQRQAVNLLFPGLGHTASLQQQPMQQVFVQLTSQQPLHGIPAVPCQQHPPAATAVDQAGIARAERKRVLAERRQHAQMHKRQCQGTTSRDLQGESAKGAGLAAAGVTPAMWAGAAHWQAPGVNPWQASGQDVAGAAAQSALAAAALAQQAAAAAAAAAHGQFVRSQVTGSTISMTPVAGQSTAVSDKQSMTAQAGVDTTAPPHATQHPEQQQQPMAPEMQVPTCNRGGPGTEKICGKCHGLWKEHVVQLDTGASKKFEHGAKKCPRLHCPGHPEASAQAKQCLADGVEPLCSQRGCRYYHGDAAEVYAFMSSRPFVQAP